MLRLSYELSRLENDGLNPGNKREVSMYIIPPYKRWGSVAELTCHLQGVNPLWDEILSHYKL
jgi:hypothetical protein